VARTSHRDRQDLARPGRDLMPLWRRVLCFVLGVAIILAAVGSAALILSGARAVCLARSAFCSSGLLLVRS
jgi:hypothetical protein